MVAPSKLGIIVDAANYSIPRLTTVDMPPDVLGRTASDALRDAASSENVKAKEFVIKINLVAGGSPGPARMAVGRRQSAADSQSTEMPSWKHRVLVFGANAGRLGQARSCEEARTNETLKAHPFLSAPVCYFLLCVLYQLPRSPRLAMTLERRSAPFSQFVCMAHSAASALPRAMLSTIITCSPTESPS